jgi:hypothetical protein
MLNSTISTFRKVFTTDGNGSSTWTDNTAILVGVAASVQPQPTQEGFQAGSLTKVKVWDVYILPGQDVKPGDVMNDPDGSGTKCEILSFQDLSGRIMCGHLVASLVQTVTV